MFTFFMKIEMPKPIVILLISLVFVLSACTTSTYGKNFSQHSKPNQYTLTVYTGGFAGMKEARSKAEIKAKQFMKNRPEYKSYREVSSKWTAIPSGATFVYEFEK